MFDRERWVLLGPLLAGGIGVLLILRGMTEAMLELGSEGVYKQNVWNRVAIVGVVAIVLAVAAFFTRRRPLGSMLAVAVAPAVMLAAIGVNVYAWRALHVYQPQLDAVNKFVPPAGADKGSTATSVSDRPSASRTWDVPGPGEAACAAARASLEKWADPATFKQTKNSDGICEFSARHDGDDAVLRTTTMPYPEPGSPPVVLSLTVTAG